MHPAPLIGVTLGDPAGIGPEVTVRAAAAVRNAPQPCCQPVMLGDMTLVEETVERLSAGLRPYLWQVGDSYPPDLNRLPVLAVSALDAKDRLPGRPTPAGGDAAYRCVEAGVRLAMNGDLDALVTAPVCKAMWYAAGHRYLGHTELLAHLTRTPEVRMMLVGRGLRVMLVTTHLRLAAVPSALSIERIATTVTLAAAHLRRFHGLERPRLAVAALNPHAGEAGAFGDEECRVIEPAVARAREGGADVVGPLSADNRVRPRDPRRVRRRGVPIPRSGAHPAQTAGLGGRGERHAGVAHRAYRAGPRHRVRHCRTERSQSAQHERGVESRCGHGADQEGEWSVTGGEW